MVAWGQLWTQGGRVRGPESSLPGPTLCNSGSQEEKEASA